MPPDCYHPRCGSTTRTCDLQVMSLTSYQLLYPAMFFICGCKGKAIFLNCQIISLKFVHSNEIFCHFLHKIQSFEHF